LKQTSFVIHYPDEQESLWEDEDASELYNLGDGVSEVVTKQSKARPADRREDASVANGWTRVRQSKSPTAFSLANNC
jgi:hypothetical protein